jgi:hypothetical protein
MSFQSKISDIAPTQVRPPKSTIFPDHPHPTMLVEGGQEPGDGPGWKSWKIKKKEKEGINGEGYKTKQRELYQAGIRSLKLSTEGCGILDTKSFDWSLSKSLPDTILDAPYDESRFAICSRLGWDRHKWRPAAICVALTRDFYRNDERSIGNTNINHKLKEVPL